MRFNRLILTCAALLALPALARAEETPPPPANTPAPAPAAHVTEQPKARKEDEAETTTAGLMARLKAWGTGKNELADEIAGLKKALEESQATVAQLQAENERLTGENTALRKDVADFAAWMEARQGTTPAGSTPEGKKASAAISAGVAAAVRQIGVPVADVPSAGSNGGTSAAEEIDTLTAKLADASPAEAGRIAARLKELRKQQRNN